MIEFVTRVALFLFGIVCVGCEVWQGYEFAVGKDGRLTAGSLSMLVVISLASVLPIGSEFARRMGRPWLSCAFRLALPLALVGVFVAAIQRNGTAIDTDENARKQVAEAVRIAKAEEAEAAAQLVIDKRLVADNCEIWGPKCQKAKDAQAATEAKLATARGGLRSHGVVGSDPLAARIVAYSRGYLTEAQVQLYLPLLTPMGLAIGSYLLLTGAFLHRKDPAQLPEPPKPAEPEIEVLRPAPLPLPAAARPKLVVNNPKPPAGFISTLTDLLEQASDDRVHLRDLYRAYATRVAPEDRVDPKEFGAQTALFCKRLRIITSGGYLVGVKLAASFGTCC